MSLNDSEMTDEIFILNSLESCGRVGFIKRDDQRNFILRIVLQNDPPAILRYYDEGEEPSSIQPCTSIKEGLSIIRDITNGDFEYWGPEIDESELDADDDYEM